MIRASRQFWCAVNHKEVYLQQQAKRLGAWKYKQYMKQASAMDKLRSSYAMGTEKLVSDGTLSAEDAAKWEKIDEHLISLQQNTKELLWHSRRRISRDYASSEDGLGKYPKSSEE